MLVNLKHTFTKPDSYEWTDLAVLIADHPFNTPSRLYAASGDLLAADGVVVNPANGEVDVWVKAGELYNLSLVVAANRKFAFQIELAVDPAASAVPSTAGEQVDDLWAAGIAAGTVMPGSVSFGFASITGLDIFINAWVLNQPFTGDLGSSIDWGDGNTDLLGDFRETQVGHTYAEAGTYNITVKARNPTTAVLGRGVTKSVTVESSTGPSDFEFVLAEFDDGTLLVLPTDNTIIIPSSLIDFGDGTSGVGVDPYSLAHTYAPGVYNFVFTERNNGVPTGRVGRYVVDTTATTTPAGASPFVPTISASTANAITGTTDVQFVGAYRTQLGSAPPPAGSWDFGDGNTATDDDTVNHTYATDGDYTVTYTRNAKTTTFNIKALTVPGHTDTLVFADNFNAADETNPDGRVPSTPYVDVLTAWEDNGFPLVIRNNSLVNDTPASARLTAAQYVEGGGDVPVTSTLYRSVLDVDWIPAVGVGASIYMASKHHETPDATDGLIAQLDWGTNITPGRATFSFYSFDGSSVSLDVPYTVGVPMHIQILVLSNIQVLQVNDAIAFQQNTAGSRGPLNMISVGPSQGDAFDNLTVKEAVTA